MRRWLRRWLATICALAVVLCAPASAGLYFPPGGSSYSPTNPLPATYGGLGPYVLPTPAAGSTDFFDGDSITAGTGASSCSGTSTTPSGTCFADLVAIHDGTKEINVAVGGTCLEYTTTVASLCNNSSSTVGSLIQRYAHDAASLSAGMRVYLQIGTNDLDMGVGSDTQVNATTFQANLVTVAQAFSAIVGSKNVVLGEIPSTYASNQYPMLWFQLNNAIARVAANYGYSLAVNSAVVAQCVTSNAYGDTCQLSDNVHPDTLGHAALASSFEFSNYTQAVASAASDQQLLGTVFFWYAGLPASGNVAFGPRALLADRLSGGVGETAVGGQALYSLISGFGNTAVGFQSLYSNVSAVANAAFGYQALQNSTSPSNAAFGAYALNSATSGGGNNAALGEASLGQITTGAYNTGAGYQAGAYISGGSTHNTTSSEGVYIGANSEALASGDTYETVVGTSAVGIGSNSVTVQSGTAPGFYSGTGAPTFSAPNGSEYSRYDGTYGVAGTGSLHYVNTSGASTSGTTWTDVY